MAYDHRKIKCRYIILCEGIDTEGFLISYLNSKALRYDERFSNVIQTFDFGGVSNLANFLQTLKQMDGFDGIDHILVLRDAEKNVDQAISMVRKAFCEANLPVPDSVNRWIQDQDKSISTAFTLMPTCDAKPTIGTLEDLCWNILKHDKVTEIKNDVAGFVNDVKLKYESISTHEHKSKLHTYLSVNERFISLKVGEAAKAGAFDWESEVLDSLKNLIAEGF